MNELDKRVKLLQAQLNAGNIRLKVEGNKVVPSKKKSKPLPYKMQNTFKKNLQGVPSGGIIGMTEAKGTGTKVADSEQLKRLGVMRSAWNSNTTQGNYIKPI